MGDRFLLGALITPTLDCILLFFTKMSENKTWAEDPQYDSL